MTYYRCNLAWIEPRWLQAFLGSTPFLSQLADIQEQSTRDFVSIGEQYRQFVLLPPLTEQRRMVAELEALDVKLVVFRRLQAETAAEIDALLPAILDRAFTGVL